jgi:hypothetical protein
MRYYEAFERDADGVEKQ